MLLKKACEKRLKLQDSWNFTLTKCFAVAPLAISINGFENFWAVAQDLWQIFKSLVYEIRVVLWSFLNINILHEFVVAKISSSFIIFSCNLFNLHRFFLKNWWVRRTHFSNLMGSVEPIEPMLTEPLAKNSRWMKCILRILSLD